MRKSVITAMVVVFTFATFGAFAAGTASTATTTAATTTSSATAKPAAAPATKAPASKSLSGTVASVDETGKSLVVKTKDGKDVTVVWTDKTKVTGGKLAAGESVKIKWMEKDGKNEASSISIHKASTHTTSSKK